MSGRITDCTSNESLSISLYYQSYKTSRKSSDCRQSILSFYIDRFNITLKLKIKTFKCFKLGNIKSLTKFSKSNLTILNVWFDTKMIKKVCQKNIEIE